MKNTEGSDRNLQDESKISGSGPLYRDNKIIMINKVILDVN